MRQILKKDSSQPLLDGLEPTPDVEVEFWKQKACNLECVYDQVTLTVFSGEDMSLITCTCTC